MIYSELSQPVAINELNLYFLDKDIIPEKVFDPIYNKNLYITNEEEIEDGDWCYEINSAYPTGLPRVLKCHRRVGDIMYLESGWQRYIKLPATGTEMVKIVYSTDEKLGLDTLMDVTSNLRFFKN